MSSHMLHSCNLHQRNTQARVVYTENSPLYTLRSYKVRWPVRGCKLKTDVLSSRARFPIEHFSPSLSLRLARALAPTRYTYTHTHIKIEDYFWCLRFTLRAHCTIRRRHYVGEKVSAAAAAARSVSFVRTHQAIFPCAGV